jgi:hypothetical protein
MTAPATAPPIELLRLAARAEFHDDPPEHVAAWLASQGVADLS